MIQVLVRFPFLLGVMLIFTDIEEWNGQREITTESFKFDFASAPTFIIFVLAIPYVQVPCLLMHALLSATVIFPFLQFVLV